MLTPLKRLMTAITCFCLVGSIAGCKLEATSGQHAVGGKVPADGRGRDASPAVFPSGGKVTLVTEGINTYGERLFDVLDSGNDNLVFSPVSTYVSLAMAYAGAEGETAQQFARTLNDHSGQQLHQLLPRLLQDIVAGRGDTTQLLLTNGLWLQKEYAVKPTYLKTCRDAYGAEVKTLDFGNGEHARTAINGWIAEATRQRIKELIPKNQLTQQTRLVLANAVYFKGLWQEPFDGKLTRNEPFMLTSGVRTVVPTMYREGYYRYAASDAVRMLEIPYAAGRNSGLSMVLIMPDKVGGILRPNQLTHGFDILERSLVRIYLPKFRVSSTFSLKEALVKMGIRDAFDEGTADFSGIIGNTANRLFISYIAHNAVVVVNEEGTEAAAGSGIVMGTKSMIKPEAIEFRVDRPFIFAIRENDSGSILFWGRVTDPRN